MASGRLIDYLGADLIANRDPTPDLHPNTLGIFYATDTDTLSIWDGTAWSDVVGSSTVNTVAAGTGIDVDATDPANPEVSLDSATQASLALADSAIQAGDLGSMAYEDVGDYELAFTKGDLIAGTGVSFTGSGTGRLVGAGSLTITATGGGSGGSIVRTHTTTPYTLAESTDNGYWLEHQGGEIRLPETASSGFAVNDFVEIIQSTSTPVTFVADTGSVVIEYSSALFSLETRYQGGAVVLKCIATNTWRIVGALADV